MDITTFKFYVMFFLSFALFVSIIIFFYYITLLCIKIKDKQDLLPVITAISSHLAYLSAIIFFIYQNCKDNEYINIKLYNFIFLITIVITSLYVFYTIILYIFIKKITNNKMNIIIAIIDKIPIIKDKRFFKFFVILFLFIIIIIILTKA